MRSIMFNVRRETNDEQQGELLDRLKEMPGIAQTGCLSPHAKNLELRRMCFAYVADDADIDKLQSEIRRQPEVEEANLPAERRLV